MTDDRRSFSSPPARELDLILHGGELSQGHTGVAVYLRRLIHALSKGPETLRWAVAMPEPRRRFLDFLPPERQLIVPGSDARGYLWNEIAWQTRVARWCRAQAPQAVFHSAFHFWSPVAPRRTMITAHDCIEMRVPEVEQRGRVRRLHRRLCWRMARHAAQVITVSKWSRQELVELVKVPPQRITVIYNWVGAEYTQRHHEDALSAMRAAYGLPPRYIAYLGGFRSYKNLPLLVESWTKARPLGGPPLVVAGALPTEDGGGFYTDVRSLIEKAGAAGKDIFLPGAIRDEDLPAFYAGASLFVSPSLFEGFGYPAVEASASGTPVLVADRSAYRELFPERCRFPADDAQKLSEKILAALQDPAKSTQPLDARLTEERGKQEYESLVRTLLHKK